LNEVAMGLGRDEVAEVLTGRMISFFPRRYIAEIEGEHYCKPYLEKSKGWEIKSNDSTLLAQALAKCRGLFGEPYAYAAANILEIWKQLRGEWSGLNLSRLDFSKELINGMVCSRLYKKTYLAARFDESLIPTKSFFPQGCSFLNLHPGSQLTDEDVHRFYLERRGSLDSQIFEETTIEDIDQFSLNAFRELRKLEVTESEITHILECSGRH
jgi:hypothetical protein